MKLLHIIKSREQCAEAGWYAYDYILDQALEEEFIVSLQALGSLVYLQMLKKPFFKVETDHFLLKGIEGDKFFRLAVHGDYLEVLEKVTKFIEKIEVDPGTVKKEER